MYKEYSNYYNDMKSTNVLAIFVLFLLSCVKYILYGLGKSFNTINFHHVQFTAFNNYFLLDHKIQSMNDVIKVSLLSLFGLFPYDNDSTTKNGASGIISLGNNELYNTTHQYTRYILQTNNIFDNSTQSDITKTITWVDDNKFLVTLIIITFIFLSAIIGKVLCQYFLCRTEGDDASEALDNIRWKKYYSFVFKILLIAYCNLSTMIIYQLITMTEKHLALCFLAVVMTLVYIIGFPIYIFIVLNNRNNKLDHVLTKMKYGPLYEMFKSDEYDSKFILLILFKQFCYAIIINSNDILGVAGNSILTIVNCAYLLIMIFKNPYKKNKDMIVSITMSSIVAILTLMNYIFILEHMFDNEIIEICAIIGFSLHVLTIIISIITSIASYCSSDKKTQEPLLKLSDKKSDEIELQNIEISDKIKEDSTQIDSTFVVDMVMH